jgi:hypothetical protein
MTEFKACSVGGCHKNAHQHSNGRKGLCVSHYKRLLRHGDPLGGGTPMGEPMRFIREIAVPYRGDECLIWPFGKWSNGYGVLNRRGPNIGAHRFICRLVNGEPPDITYDAAHSFGNGHLGCVNHRHLSWKTRSENLADRLLHGTHDRGERSVNAKLTDDNAKEILSLRGTISQTKIAKKFGVSQTCVSMIHRRLTWPHIDA